MAQIGGTRMTVSRLSEVRQNVRGPLEVKPRQHVGTELHLLVASPTAQDGVAEELALYHLSHIYYPPDTILESDSLGAYESVAYIGVLLSFVANPSSLTAAIISAYATADVKIIVTSANRLDRTAAYLQQDPAYMRLCETIQAKWITGFMSNRQVSSTVCSVIFMLIYKTLTPENAQEWVKSRYNTFGGTVGLSNISTSTWVTTLPNIVACASLTSFFGSCERLRVYTFNILRGLASSQGGNVIGQACREVVQMLSGSGLTHLILIDRYLVNMFSELFSLPALDSESAALRQALHILDEADESERFYLRILYPKQETSLLERRHFPNCIAAASAIAQVLNKSMEFFVSMSKNNPFMIKFVAGISEYVRARHDRPGMVSLLSAGGMSSAQRALIMNQMAIREAASTSTAPQFEGLAAVIGTGYDRKKEDPSHPVNVIFAKQVGVSPYLPSEKPEEKE